MTIRAATFDDIPAVAEIIRSAYRTVADRLDLTPENCPKHPSNCTPDWVRADFQRGVAYFILKDENGAVGCAALEQADSKFCYLERLAVVPESRRGGYGRRLVDFIFDRARELGCQRAGIGIIAEQDDLRRWYGRIGFEEKGTKRFDHLPFSVRFMEYDLVRKNGISHNVKQL